MIRFGENERGRDELVLDALVPATRFLVPPVTPVEQCVDQRRIKDDHADPKPVSSR